MLLVVLAFVVGLRGTVAQENHSGPPAATGWRAATEAELRKVIPERAPVISERIETDARSASGITDPRRRFIAGAVLITAGYSAAGKF